MFDVSYGGNYYAIVDPQKNFSGIQDFTASKIVQFSQIVRERINQKYPNLFVHPEDETIRDVTHMLWTGDVINPNSSGRNAVFYGDKAIDRSPCGTGTSARLAQLHAKGKLKNGQDYIDSGTDLVFDVIGALFASLLIWRFHIPEKEHEKET